MVHQEKGDGEQPGMPDDLCLTIVVLGASGDLAKKKTFPALWRLYKSQCVPVHARVQEEEREREKELRERVCARMRASI